MTTAVIARVAQRMASFCSLGMSMMPSPAMAGRKTIVERRNSGLIMCVPMESRFQRGMTNDQIPMTIEGSYWSALNWSLVLGPWSLPALAGQCGTPEEADEDKNGDGADDDEHHVLADAPGLDGPEAEAERVGPGGKQVDKAIDDSAVGHEVPNV